MTREKHMVGLAIPFHNCVSASEPFLLDSARPACGFSDLLAARISSVPHWIGPVCPDPSYCIRGGLISRMGADLGGVSLWGGRCPTTMALL